MLKLYSPCGFLAEMWRKKKKKFELNQEKDFFEVDFEIRFLNLPKKSSNNDLSADSANYFTGLSQEFKKAFFKFQMSQYTNKDSLCINLIATIQFLLTHLHYGFQIQDEGWKQFKYFFETIQLSLNKNLEEFKKQNFDIKIELEPKQEQQQAMQHGQQLNQSLGSNAFLNPLGLKNKLLENEPEVVLTLKFSVKNLVCFRSTEANLEEYIQEVSRSIQQTT